MRFFFRHQQPPPISEAEAGQIRERVRSMRDQIGKRDVELADLFALLGEDERPLLRDIQEVERPDLARFWPQQVPARQVPPEKPEAQDPQPIRSFGWEDLQKKGLVTLP